MIPARICPMCGATVPEQFASCRALFEEICAREYTDSAFGAVHLLTLDVYALQHSEEHGPRSNAFHLMRLCSLLDVNPIHWFLNGKDATRSSYYLEDAATEFQVQGLELDWACVAWDGDLRFSAAGWNYSYFRGDRWCRIANDENKRYLQNAYRVLLTRARQGMVIYVPHGNASDPTRDPSFYDPTYQYLVDIGMPEMA